MQKPCQLPFFLCQEIFLTNNPAAYSAVQFIDARHLPGKRDFRLSAGGASPEPSGDALPASKRGLVFTAVTVVTTVPHGITVRSFSIFAAGTGGGICQGFTSPGSM